MISSRIGWGILDLGARFRRGRRFGVAICLQGNGGRTQVNIQITTLRIKRYLYFCRVRVSIDNDHMAEVDDRFSIVKGAFTFVCGGSLEER